MEHTATAAHGTALQGRAALDFLLGGTGEGSRRSIQQGRSDQDILLRSWGYSINQTSHCRRCRVVQAAEQNLTFQTGVAYDTGSVLGQG